MKNIDFRKDFNQACIMTLQTQDKLSSCNFDIKEVGTQFFHDNDFIETN